MDALAEQHLSMGPDELLRAIGQLKAEAGAQISAAANAQELEAARVKYLGGKSAVLAILKQIGQRPPEQRGPVGKAANEFKRDIDTLLAERKAILASASSTGGVDVTLPGVGPRLGRLHPITQTMQAIVDCFVPMGFEVVQGPELDYEWYNFDALNIPADHPSRESFDTFFVEAPPLAGKGHPLLRSHTSPVQIHVMQSRKPPLRIIVPGRVYRPDALDASHSFMFHQVEGLMVDDRTSFSDLKGVLAQFIERFFGKDARMRFRPHFFPFTEPSAEVDLACATCGGAGCQTCGRKGWLEILGCGMVHPNVLKAVGYDPKKVQGFAFGMGVERMAMLRHGITDIRLFFDNDLRFLEQF